MVENLVKSIQDYIESHSVCSIAVSDGDSPGAHSVYYVSNGFNIYFGSDPASQKIHILRTNPAISLTIDEHYADWKRIKGIQLFGRANLSDETNASLLQKMFSKKFPHINDIGGIPNHHVFVEVVPEKIYFLDFSKNFGHKSVFYPKKNSSKISWSDIRK